MEEEESGCIIPPVSCVFAVFAARFCIYRKAIRKLVMSPLCTSSGIAQLCGCGLEATATPDLLIIVDVLLDKVRVTRRRARGRSFRPYLPSASSSRRISFVCKADDEEEKPFCWNQRVMKRWQRALRSQCVLRKR